jgi:hypothetical protein
VQASTSGSSPTVTKSVRLSSVGLAPPADAKKITVWDRHGNQRPWEKADQLKNVRCVIYNASRLTAFATTVQVFDYQPRVRGRMLRRRYQNADTSTGSGRSVVQQPQRRAVAWSTPSKDVVSLSLLCNSLYTLVCCYSRLWRHRLSTVLRPSTPTVLSVQSSITCQSAKHRSSII